MYTRDNIDIHSLAHSPTHTIFMYGRLVCSNTTPTSYPSFLALLSRTTHTLGHTKKGLKAQTNKDSHLLNAKKNEN